MAQGSWIQVWSQWDLLKLNSFSFGITGFILAMDTVVLPIIVLTVAPEGLKNTYLAILGISGLIMAALIQPTIGRISDRTQFPLGRRVPFIIWGSVFAAVGLIGIRLAPNFGVLFGVWLFIQANVNIAYGPGLALIRDCVPLNRIGMASSMKIMSDHKPKRKGKILPEWGNIDHPVTGEDLKILQRAKEMLSDKSKWNSNDNGICNAEDTSWSLYCALHKASLEILGEFQQHRVALMEVHGIIHELMKSEDSENRLMDFNNSKEFGDIHKVLDDAIEQLRKG